ncbi:MAG: O-antigen ligase family protein [Proteobacteria bacterium]|nr:O-antigen ligase family protein [Pseudomonadota bacterium]
MTTGHGTSREQPTIYILGALLILVTVAFLPTRWYFLAPLPALAVLVVCMMWRWPMWGFSLLLFFIPFDQYRSLSEQFSWFTISKLVGALLVLLVLSRWLILHRTPALRSKMWPFLALFMLTALVATFYTNNLPTAINELRQLATAIIFFALTLCLVPYRSLFKSVPLALVLGVSGSALLSLYGYVTANPLFAVQVGSEELNRAVGGSNDPNLFSVSLLFSLPILVHYFFEARLVRWRIASALLALGNIMALVITFSRGGALNFMVLSLLLVMEHYKRLSPRKAGLLLTAALAAGLMVMAFIPSSYWERQRSVVQTSDDSISRRIDYITVGWDQFIKSPFIGHGPGVFKELWAETVHAGDVEKGQSRSFLRPAHNTYLEMLVGTGLLGLGFYLCVILAAWRNFREAQQRLHEAGRSREASMAGAYKIAFAAMLIYFLILSAQTHKFFWVSLAFSQLLLVGSMTQDKETP